MRNPGLVTSLFGVFGALTALLLVAGVFVHPILIAVAIPFGLVSVVFFYHASGLLEARVLQTRRTGSRRRRSDARRTDGAGSARSTSARQRRAEARERYRDARRQARTGLTVRAAYRELGLEAGASQSAIREAYREKAKTRHPDRGGDEARFRRLNRAYDLLQQ